MIFSLALILLGLILLVVGGDILVRGAVNIAGRLGMSKALIGVTLVGFGTSMPEFVATFGAAAKGAPDIAFGNVIGSNTANILMILGASALICPIATRMHGLARDAIFVSFASLAALYWIYSGGIAFIGALVLIAAFILYMTLTIRADVADERLNPSSIPAAPTTPFIASLALAIGGIVLLIGGAESLIRGASTIAREAGISEAIIGITIVGIGTSLPEASASIIASLKRENDLAFANIVGSNIFNGLAILGLTGALIPLRFTPAALGGFTLADGAVLCAATAVMFITALTHKRITRWEGAALLLAYAAYIVWLVLRAIGAV